MIWFIGPESKVYHDDRYCPALNNPYRYWPVQSAKTPPARRRLCGHCKKRGQR